MVSTFNITYFIFHECPDSFKLFTRTLASDAFDIHVWQQLCERDTLGFHRPPLTVSRDVGSGSKPFVLNVICEGIHQVRYLPVFER